MKPDDYVALGRYLKKIRRQKGHSLDNVADENISTSTISILERGLPGVSEEKIEYLCEKLGVNYSQYPELIQRESTKREQLLRKLKGIESLLGYIQADFPIEKLTSIGIDQEDELYVYFTYLKSMYYYRKNQWVKSRDGFQETQQLLKQYPSYETSNILASCYKELGRISYFYEGDTEKALQLNEQGLTCFNSNGERSFLKYSLLVTKAFYLEKLNRGRQANRTLNLLFAEEDKIDSSDARINMYEIRAFLLIKDKYFEEAREYVERGVEIALANKQIDRGFELWTSLGNICSELDKLKEAEEYFLLALDLKNFVKVEFLLVSTYTQLGRLYLKQRKWDLAKENLTKAVDIGEKSSDESRYIDALEAMGDYYLKRDELEQAIQPYEQALELAEKHSFYSTANNCQIKLGHCYKRKHPAKYQECVEKAFAHAIKSKLDSLHF